MQSTNISYYPRLDHLRALAVVIVLAFHVYHYAFQHWQPNPEAGWAGLVIEGHTGVALFFVLSGFLFMLIALKGPIHYSSFIYNRFVRVFPLFLVIFILSVTLGRDEFQATDIFYLMFTNIGSPPTSDFFVTGPAWTISVEFSFYLIFPFIAANFIAYGLRYMLGLLMLLLFFKLVVFFHVDDPIHVFYSTLIGRLDQFFVGMVAAVGYKKHKVFFENCAWLMFSVAIVLIFCLLWYLAVSASWAGEQRNHPWWLIWSGVEASAWAAIVVSYLCLPRVNFPLSSSIAKLASGLGRISYSFYLLHASVIYVLYSLFSDFNFFSYFYINFIFSFFLVFLVSAVFSLVSYSCIEKPFLIKRKRYVAE